MDFERIRASGKTLYLSDTSEVRVMGVECLKGTQVNREGEFVYEKGGVFVDHVISLDQVTKRTEVVYNRTYGILETST
jgi:hypothetical protein